MSSNRTAPDRPFKLVRSLAQISKDNIEAVDGNGMNLGETRSEDLEVPEAFVVTMDAYGSFLRSNAKQEKIEKLLRDLDVDGARKLGNKAALVQKMIESPPAPERRRGRSSNPTTDSGEG